MKVHPLSSGNLFLSLLLAGSLVFPIIATAEESFEPSLKPTYNVPRLQSSIKIDGLLDDTGWIGIKATSRMKIEQVYRFSTLKRQDNDVELFKGFIYRSRINYQFTRELFLRLILQYNDFDDNFDIDPLLSYKLNPFTIFYIGSTYDYTDVDDSNNLTLSSRQFFMKFQYLFRM